MCFEIFPNVQEAHQKQGLSILKQGDVSKSNVGLCFDFSWSALLLHFWNIYAQKKKMNFVVKDIWFEEIEVFPKEAHQKKGL